MASIDCPSNVVWMVFHAFLRWRVSQFFHLSFDAVVVCHKCITCQQRNSHLIQFTNFQSTFRQFNVRSLWLFSSRPVLFICSPLCLSLSVFSSTFCLLVALLAFLFDSMCFFFISCKFFTFKNVHKHKCRLRIAWNACIIARMLFVRAQNC